MEFVEKMSRIFGGHDLKFRADRWLVSFDESHVENTTSCERKIFFEGEFLNWPFWKHKVSVRLVSQRTVEYDHDENGQGICGLVSWSKGVSNSGSEIEGFDNGSIEVSSVVSPELFDSILVLLRNDGTNLRADFTLSSAPPQQWNGLEPLRINAVGILAEGR